MPPQEQRTSSPSRQVLVCQNCTCVERGADQVLKAFERADLPTDVTVKGADCQGQCSSGPTIRIIPEETWYCLIQPQDVEQIVTQHLQGGQQVEEKLHPRIHPRFIF